jgi:hypothetical protein
LDRHLNSKQLRHSGFEHAPSLNTKIETKLYLHGVFILALARFARVRRGRRERRIDFFEKSLRRRFSETTHASGGVLFAEREIFFDCRPLSGNQKLFILCDLCVLCERSSFVFGCDWAV